MEDGKTWACFKEWHEPYFERTEGDGEVTTATTVVADTKVNIGVTMDNTVASIRKLPHAPDEARGTTKEDAKAFGIRYEFSEVDGSIEKVYYPYTKGGKLCGYKVRGKYKEGDRAVEKGKVEVGTLKKFYTVGDMRGVDLFGQAILKGHSKLVLTEGEEDIKAARHMIGERYPDMALDYLSLPTGVSLGRDGVASLTDIIMNKDVFDKAEEVFLLMDNDDAGNAMLKALSQFLGDKARVISLPEKDASDMLTKGREREFISNFFSAGEYKPDFIVEIGDILEEAVEEVEWGVSYPWENVTKSTYGIRLNEVIGIAGAPSGGKTVFTQQIIKHLLDVEDKRVGIISCEERPSMTLKKMIGFAMNKKIQLPDCVYDKEVATSIGSTFQDKLFIYGHHGSFKDWENIANAVRYYYAQGVEYFFIDPLSALVSHLSPSDGNTMLGIIMGGDDVNVPRN